MTHYTVTNESCWSFMEVEQHWQAWEVVYQPHILECSQIQIRVCPLKILFNIVVAIFLLKLKGDFLSFQKEGKKETKILRNEENPIFTWNLFLTFWWTKNIFQVRVLRSSLKRKVIFSYSQSSKKTQLVYWLLYFLLLLENRWNCLKFSVVTSLKHSTFNNFNLQFQT